MFASWAYVGRERGGAAPLNIFSRLSKSIRRNTHIRPTLASGEHGAPVQGLGPVVVGEFSHTTHCPGVGAGSGRGVFTHNSLSRGWGREWSESFHTQLTVQGLGPGVVGEFSHTTNCPGVGAGSGQRVFTHNLLSRGVGLGVVRAWCSGFLAIVLALFLHRWELMVSPGLRGLTVARNPGRNEGLILFRRW
jgi:hypothetical protein